MKKYFENFENKKVIFIAVGGILLLFAVVMIVFWRKNTETKEVAAYLKELEEKDLEKTEKAVKKVQREAKAEAAEKGELSIWAQFNDYVIFGDSRTVGFYFHEFLEKQRVIAEGGLTIQALDTYLPQIKVLNPSSLFLCTGLNDVSIGYWKTPEEYVKAYEEKIQMLQKELPDTKIYINSIFPAQDPAFDRESDWKKIPEYNKAVKAWCKKNDYAYIDNTEVYEEHKDLYDTDGIHFKKDFYEYWAINMVSQSDM